jgi:hypothetical protein
MADINASDPDSSLPNITPIAFPRRAAAAASAASAAPHRRPGDRQSNPIELPDTSPPRQAVPQLSNEAVQGSPWLRRPWFTVPVHRATPAAPAQDLVLDPRQDLNSFPPLPPPGTENPPTRCERRAASIQPTEDYDALWLRSPLPVVEIERPEWKPNPRLHGDLVPVVKAVVDSMPAHHLLKPYDGEVFEDPKAAFDRY